MDISYLYYHCKFQYYKFLIYKIKLEESWNRLNNTTKYIYCLSICFGSVFGSWLVYKCFKRKLAFQHNEDVVQDIDDTSVKSKRRKNGIPPGLWNDGNTCFLNCVLQALSSCPSFFKWTCEVKKQYGFSRVILFPSVCNIFKVLTNTTGNELTYSTGDVIASFQSHGWIIGNDQQDAYEFLQILTSTLEEELTKMVDLPSNSLMDLRIKPALSSCIYNKVTRNLPVLMNKDLTVPFKGSFATRLTCISCDHQLPVKFELFDSLILSLTNVSPFAATLYSCLNEWIKPELLHQVECETCKTRYGKKYSTFSKQVALAKLPQCLCIQLQRTTYSNLGLPQKNRMFVQFPETLDIKNYSYGSIINKENQKSKMRKLRLPESPPLPGGAKDYPGADCCVPTRYNLSSVIVHFGGADGGHFITCRKVYVNNTPKWFQISDAIVKSISKEQMLMSTAYLLFYEKVS